MSLYDNIREQKLFTTDKPLEIREATIVDYELLIGLRKEAGLPYKPTGRDSRERVAKEMNAGHGVFLIGFIDENAVAAVLVTQDGRKGWINRLAVLPDFQKKGIGKQLVVAGEHWLMEQGIGIFACLIEEYNANSYAVFQKMGYLPFEGIHYLTKRLDPGI
ncbi:MAG: GNAT family N-acetyltransferase [Bacteroidales bacterium]|jgi:GNAT superfamily N-acetyltransferase